MQINEMQMQKDVTMMNEKQRKIISDMELLYRARTAIDEYLKRVRGGDAPEDTEELFCDYIYFRIEELECEVVKENKEDNAYIKEISSEKAKEKKSEVRNAQVQRR